MGGGVVGWWVRPGESMGRRIERDNGAVRRDRSHVPLGSHTSTQHTAGEAGLVVEKVAVTNLGEAGAHDGPAMHGCSVVHKDAFGERQMTLSVYGLG